MHLGIGGLPEQQLAVQGDGALVLTDAGATGGKKYAQRTILRLIRQQLLNLLPRFVRAV
jgi:hypothetical protein